jgi:hypothetical protein
LNFGISKKQRLANYFTNHFIKMKKFTLTCLLLTLFILNVVADKISHEVTLQLQKSKTIDVVVLLKKEINYETLFQGKENLHIDVKAQIIVDNVKNNFSKLFLAHDFKQNKSKETFKIFTIQETCF